MKIQKSRTKFQESVNGNLALTQKPLRKHDGNHVFPSLRFRWNRTTFFIRFRQISA